MKFFILYKNPFYSLALNFLPDYEGEEDEEGEGGEEE